MHRVRVALFLIALSFAGAAFGQQMIVVAPMETDELLPNPDIGWETFRHTSKQDKNLPSWICSTVQYVRWGWRELEPRQGKIDTDLLDKVLKESHEAGQKLALRVMCCSPYKGRPYHPAWLKDIGATEMMAEYRHISYPVPDLDEPVVLNAHLDFIKRLGERYDGHADIDRVEIGSVGWWGEWHLTGSKSNKLPTLENRMRVVDAYFAAFRKTSLMMLLNGKECTTYAAQHGAGWRADSLGDLGAFSSKWNHMRDSYPAWIRETKVQDVWKTAPVAYEPPNAVAEFAEKGWPLRWIFNYGLACHGSYFNGKSGKLPDDPQFREELTRFLRRLGYRLVLKELKHPAEASGMLELTMKWQNVGSAPCYRPYRLAYRLANDKGFSKVIVSNIAVNHWLPGSIELFTPEFFQEVKDLPPGDVYDVSDKLTLADIPAGQYALSVGIVDQLPVPVVRMGIKGRADDGWYPMSTIKVAK